MNKKTIMISGVTTATILSILMAGMFATNSMLIPNVALAQKSSNSTSNRTTSTTTTTTNKTATNAGFLAYENTTLGMKMQYPSNWTKQPSGRGVTFVIPLGKDNFLAKLNASALVGFPANMTLKEMADRVITTYRHFLPGFQMQSYIGNATLAGNKAIKIVYTYTDPKNNEFSATDTATVKNNKLYVIQYYYYTKSPKQQAYSQTLQKMVDSFQNTR
jgi:hypothetical protein